MKNELCGTQCSLMTELCAARMALAPMVADAEAISEVAYTMYDAARVVVGEAQRDSEIAGLEMHLAAVGLPDEELETLEVAELVDTANAALGAHINAILASEGALADAMAADPGLIKITYSATGTNITTLGDLCTKGPKGDKCRAPRAYRKYGEQALGWARKELGS